MADPMWSGGHPQFQDEYPWIWAVMSGWMQAPFYPTDPPRNPGAFADSVTPICDFPVTGPLYGYFIVKYCEEYAAAWYANPPGSSTSVATPAVPPTDSTLDDKLDTLSMQVQALHTKIGTFVETDTVSSCLYTLLGDVASLPPPPTGFTTIADTTRILAAVAFVARVLCHQQAYILDAVTATDLDAAVASIKGTDLPSIRTAQDEVLAAINGAANGINANTDLRATAVNTNIDNAETAILAAVAAIPTDEQNLNFFPGSAGVSYLAPTAVSGLAVIVGPMDGVRYTITQPVSGQSHQQTGDVHRYKGVGWLAFVDANGHAEARQQLEMSPGILKPMAMLQAASVAVCAKAGTLLTVTPYTINPS